MTIVYILLFISAITDVAISTLTSSTVFLPLLSVSSLVVIYPYMSSNKKYLKLIFIYGIITGLLYSPLLFFEAIIYIFTALFIIELNNSFKDNLGYTLIITILSIAFYRTITFFSLYLFQKISFDSNLLLESIYSSLVLNLIYVIIIYTIFDKINLKSKIKRTQWLIWQ